MRRFAITAALCLSSLAHVSAAMAADDVIINGLHCNVLCQSWLGVDGKTGRQSQDSGQLSASRPTKPAIPELPHVARRSELVVVASLHAPSFRDRLTDDAPAPSLPTDTARAPYRPTTKSKVAVIRPPTVLTASREVLPTQVEPPPPRLAPEPKARIVPLVPAPPAVVRAEPATATPDAEASLRIEDGKAQPTSSFPLVNRTSPPREASYGMDETTAASQDSRPDAQPKAARRFRPMRSDLRMEPGLTTLPRLDDVVAAHGSIMIETAEDRALAKRQMADLIKATTRPKQFRTGFIGLPSTEGEASNTSSDSPKSDVQAVTRQARSAN